MITDLKSFFAEKLTPPEGQHGDRVSHEVRYAAAALMLVCAKADFVDHPDEQVAIIRLLAETFSLDQQMIDDLIELIDEESAVRSIQTFTSMVNRYYTLDDKKILIENLWQVAFADGRLDAFEEQFVARVAFMIDIPQTEVQRRKDYISENWSL